MHALHAPSSSAAPPQFGQKRHPVGLIVVLVLHLLLGWALVSGLARKVVEVVKGPLETKIIEEVKPPPPPPPPEHLPPPPKSLPPPPAFAPPPEVQTNQPSTAPTITTTTTAPPPQEVKIAPAAVAPAPPAPPRMAARPAIGNVNACAPKSSDYPAAAARAEATGVTKVRFTVDATGKLAKAEVVKSAGASREHRLLDRMAVDKLSECSFTPGQDENGHAIGGSFDVEYVWQLN